MNQSNYNSSKRNPHIRNHDLKAGEFLFKNGDFGNEFYIIESGSLSIGQGKGTGTEQTQLAVLSSGAMVGEMSLFDGLPRSADAIATEPTRLKVITQESFDKMIETLPVWLKAVIKIVVNRIREANSRVDNHSIPKIVFSLISYISLFKDDYQKGETATSFDLYTLQDNFCFFTRAHNDDFKTAIDKLYTEGIIDIITGDSGDQTIISVNDNLLAEITQVYIDFRNKIPILAKEINNECHQAIGIIDELFNQTSQQEGEIKITLNKFMEKLHEKNPRITKRAIDPLLRFQILIKENGHLTIPKTKLNQLKLSIEALAKVKDLLK